MEITKGTNGRIYWTDERGVATRATCSWLVERTDVVGDDEYGYEPFTRIEDCGAPLTRLDDDGWECAAGHYHHTYGSAAWAAEDAAEWAAERHAAAYGEA